MKKITLTCIKCNHENNFLLNDGNINYFITETFSIYKNHLFVITFNERGNRSGYVAIPNNLLSKDKNFFEEKIHLKREIKFYDKLNCFGELFHKYEKWIGFHCGYFKYKDKPDFKAMKKYFRFSRYLEDENKDLWSPKMKVRTYKYVSAQCKKIIDQLIKHDNEL